ncbi:MAG TPA: transposase family protein [Candidatus Binatia bacterium]|nr:transposase family protein [Candidatus Binatia bacterium]
MRALFGLTVAALSELRAKVLPERLQRRPAAPARRPGRQRAVGGGRHRGLNPSQEVRLTWISLRPNVAPAGGGELFGVSADPSENPFPEGVFGLREVWPAQGWDAEKRGKKGEPSWSPDQGERGLFDRFASPGRRPSRPQRQTRGYAGQKKRHPLNSQGVTDAKGAMLDLDPGQRGPTADKRVDEQRTVEAHSPHARRPGDWAYQGMVGGSGPPKQPQGGQLTDEQRAEHRQLAALRVHVAHGMRRLTGWRIVRADYRLALGLFPLIASTVVGLVPLVRLVG